jgi:UDP-N-acetylmuramoyl-L-alanyl-D-glutamate--2,6-diaminopimelate ligase
MSGSEAIAFALQQAAPGDLVIITGKGPEPTMCLGTTEYPWSDEEQTVAALAEMGFGPLRA